jgi:hypothetical protein
MNRALTIGDLARLTGLSASTIEDCHDIGLLPLPRRGVSGEVGYFEEHINRLSVIQRALDLGFSLQDAIPLSGASGRLTTCGDAYSLAMNVRNSLLAAGKTPPARLDELLLACPRRGSAEDCPILAHVRASGCGPEPEPRRRRSGW